MEPASVSMEVGVLPLVLGVAREGVGGRLRAPGCVGERKAAADTKAAARGLEMERPAAAAADRAAAAAEAEAEAGKGAWGKAPLGVERVEMARGEVTLEARPTATPSPPLAPPLSQLPPPRL